MLSGLVLVNEQRINETIDAYSNEYTFVQLADPQITLLEKNIENPELSLFDRAISAINLISPKPKFVVICGDLVDAEPGKTGRVEQIAGLKSSMTKLVPGIPVFVLPGNHDIGNSPSMSDIEDYRSSWGSDHFVFWCGKEKYIVVNSQPYWDQSNCRLEAEAQDSWLTNELSATENANANHVIVFQHIPPFVKSADESNDYFNLSKDTRMDLLQRYYRAGVRLVFTGHLHFNGGGFWRPTEGADVLEVVSSSAVGFQLGEDKSGLRLVKDSPRIIKHKYFTLDELECNPHIVDGF